MSPGGCATVARAGGGFSTQTEIRPRQADLLWQGRGRLHLSGIERLAPHVTEENRDVLLKRAVHGSKRQIEQLVAELAPRPAAPASCR